MNTPNPPTAARSRWLDWKPKGRILADAAGRQPTKPSEPSFVGFEGSTPSESPEIGLGPHPEDLTRVGAALSRTGVRLMELAGGTTIGVWSDLDGPEVRAALGIFGSENLPVRYLDGSGIPERFKLRRVAGEPVPSNVLAEMQRLEAIFMESGHCMVGAASMAGAYPWKARDRLLGEMNWSPVGMPWAEWEAAALNRLFLERGLLGKPGRIKADTVRRGEQTWATKILGWLAYATRGRRGHNLRALDPSDVGRPGRQERTGTGMARTPIRATGWN
jgi:hypothetical protein